LPVCRMKDRLNFRSAFSERKPGLPRMQGQQQADGRAGQ
jgi:hypothetical protein